MRSVFGLLGQSDISPGQLEGLYPALGDINPATVQQLRNEALYDQYVDRQARDVELLKQDEAISLPHDFDYAQLSGLSRELAAKMNMLQPETLAAAAKIEGMTPAALTILLTVARSKGRQVAW